MTGRSQSALFLVLSIITSGACNNAAEVAEARETPPPGACGAAIARLETALSQALANGAGVGTARETVDARLHHQPTPKSVEQAATESLMKVQASLATARQMRLEGKRSECIATVGTVALAGVR